MTQLNSSDWSTAINTTIMQVDRLGSGLFPVRYIRGMAYDPCFDRVYVAGRDNVNSGVLSRFIGILDVDTGIITDTCAGRPSDTFIGTYVGLIYDVIQLSFDRHGKMYAEWDLESLSPHLSTVFWEWPASPCPRIN